MLCNGGVWDPQRNKIDKQIRMDGVVELINKADSDEYFAKRPRESQIGAWASKQSQEMKFRADFDARIADFTKKFEGSIVPRPEFWSGYRVRPFRIEFWNEYAFRLHDRVVFIAENGGWSQLTLYP